MDYWGFPKVKLENLWIGSTPDKYLLAMAPTIVTITLLIMFFPNTGLERILYLPGIYLLNSMIIFIYMNKIRFHNKKLNIISWLLIISVTIIISIWMYPQAYGGGIFEKIFSY